MRPTNKVIALLKCLTAILESINLISSWQGILSPTLKTPLHQVYCNNVAVWHCNAMISVPILNMPEQVSGSNGVFKNLKDFKKPWKLPPYAPEQPS